MTEQEREAIMRLTMCARRGCKICKYGHHRKRVTVKLPQSCMDRITENMNILADSFPKPTTYDHGREISRAMIGDVIVGIQYSDWHCVKCGYKVDGKPMFKYCPNCGRVIKESTHE